MSAPATFAPPALALSDEQRLLQETVAQVLADAAGSDDLWATLASLDLLGLPFDPADGGAGGTEIDLMVVMQELGRALTTVPYLPTVVLGGRAVQLGAHADLRAETLAAVAGGTRRLALAYLEPGAGHDWQQVSTRAMATQDCFRLNGHKTAVLGGASADQLVVTARTDDGITVFLVDAADAGVTRQRYEILDGREAAEVVLDHVEVGRDRLLGELDAGDALLTDVLDAGARCLAAEAVGAMAGALNVTIEHLRSRRQFGRPLSTFQVLRHRVADMHIALEQCRSITMLAFQGADGAAFDRSSRASAAKALVGHHGRFVGQQAVQLHGGMGVSVEHRACHYLTRLTAIDALLGGRSWHLRHLC